MVSNILKPESSKTREGNPSDLRLWSRCPCHAIGQSAAYRHAHAIVQQVLGVQTCDRHQAQNSLKHCAFKVLSTKTNASDLQE